jgi:hypothetical protein
MPRFRFVAADSTGQVHDGAIDASTQTDARNKLAANGLAVRELEEVAGGVEPISLPGRRTRSGAGEPVDTFTVQRVPRADEPGRARGGSALPLVLAIAALVVAVASAAYSALRDPLSNRLSRYDFSTPEAAYMSHLRIQATGDVPAMIELQRRAVPKQTREKLDTARVVDAVECRGKTILFIEYEVNAVRVQEIQCFEPDPEHARSFRIAHISDNEIRTFDRQLADRVAAWRAAQAGEFAPVRGMPRTP